MSNRQPHPATLQKDALLAECDVRRQRRSGPGGQHRNKVETAIFIEHTPTGVTAEACERRSQEANRQQAVFRLRVNLAIDARSDVAEKTPPSELWRSRSLGRKVTVSAEHDDFPAILAEALDRIHARQWDVKAAAETLGCSTSQLVKLLQKEPRALAVVNQKRRERDLHALK